MTNIPYANAGIAASEVGDSYGSVELFSGSTPNPVTEDFAVQANVGLAGFAVVGLSGGYLVMATQDQAEAKKATATLTFAGQPTANDTVTVGGSTYTFKAALTPAAGEVLIGASAEGSLDNLIAAINKTAAGSGTAYAAATVENASAIARKNTTAIIGLEARAAGIAGNSIALSESGSNTSVVAFAGGVAAVGVKPIGITTAPVTANAADQRVAIFRAGCFNPAALAWDASYDTDAKKAEAFRGAETPTNILIRKFL